MWEQKHSLPDGIRNIVAGLKDELGSYIAARLINGRYYLYREWKERDDNGKQRMRTEYLGKVDDSGTFRRKMSGYKLNVENATRLIESLGGKVTMPERSTMQLAKESVTDNRILTCLSMNARLSAKNIGKIVGVPAATAYAKTKKLEKDYGIDYTTQFLLAPLGYRAFMVFAKFLDKKPSAEELKKAFGKEPKIQYAASTKGEYDIIAYLLDSTSTEAAKTVLNLRSGLLGEYDAVFSTSSAAQKYGYVRLRDEFFGSELSKKVWHRSKSATDLKSGHLLEREFILMRELNLDGRLNFSEIDKRHGFGSGTSTYTYKRLFEREIIRNATIDMKPQLIRYTGIIIIKRMNMSKYLKSANSLYADLVNDVSGPVGKYSLVCDVGAPDSVILFVPVYGNGSVDDIAASLASKLKGIEISTLAVSNELVGRICLRRYDNKHTIYYENIAASMKSGSESRMTDYDV